jgi:hypothetical protein
MIMQKTPQLPEKPQEVVIVVPPAEPLPLDKIRDVVGAKNVMGTCSG